MTIQDNVNLQLAAAAAVATELATKWPAELTLAIWVADTEWGSKTGMPSASALADSFTASARTMMTEYPETWNDYQVSGDWIALLKAVASQQREAEASEERAAELLKILSGKGVQVALRLERARTKLN